MRNKIEEEQKRENIRVKEEPVSPISSIREKPTTTNVNTTNNSTFTNPYANTNINNNQDFSDREIVKTRSGTNFSFPIDMDEEDTFTPEVNYRSNQNVLVKEREKTPAPYSKKEEPKPKKFRPTPVISPIYGVLDKNYTKDEVKVQDESSYEIQRPSRKIDFETVRNKAFGNLTDDIRNNLCENCELYQEVKITKNADLKAKAPKIDNDNLLADMTEDIPIGVAEENYFDYGVSYEAPRKEDTKKVNTIANIDDVNINNDIKIVNHNEEEATAEKIEVKEPKKKTKKEKELEDTIEFEKLTTDEESADSILNNIKDAPLEDIDNDIFNLIDSMYDEEDK